MDVPIGSILCFRPVHFYLPMHTEVLLVRLHSGINRAKFSTDIKYKI